MKERMITMTKPVILIVDDESSTLEAVGSILQANYDLKVALDGATAIKYLESKIIDLAILDINMPEMNGYDIAKFINDNSIKTAYIFLSGITDQESVEKCFKLGGRDFIPKPFSNLEFLLRVKRQVEVLDTLKESKKSLDQEFHLAKMAGLGEMIGNIAHQWKQPLNGIAVVTNGIRMYQQFGELDEETLYKNLDSIDEYVQYLSVTINTFRDFIISGGSLETCKLQDEISQAVAIIRDVLNHDFVELQDTIDYSNSIRLKLVRGHLPQVLINIISNARDILLEKHVENPWVKLACEKLEHSIQITIEDNGGGVPQEIMPKIFERYFSTKDSVHGTGMGLHMSYELVTKKMNGKLYVQNTQNGAKFFIEIPLKTQEEKPEFNILYAEDDLTLAEPMYEILTSKKHVNVDMVHNGKELLEAFEEKAYDLLISDIEMPHLSGLEAIERLPCDKDEIYTIITTAYKNRDYLDDAVSSFVNKYMVKPVDIHELLGTIEEQYQKKLNG